MTRGIAGLQRGRVLLALAILVVGWCALPTRAAAFPDWTDCPAACRCKWTSGKKSALCAGAGLTSLPASLDSDMQVLDLSGNQINNLHSEIFKQAALLNLQRVYMRNAGIHQIHGDAFKNMTILVEVDLSDNSLSSLDERTFSGNVRLRLLTLSGNPLGALKAYQFPVLEHLRNLELQRCSLTEVHHQAFQNIPHLETLRLDNNALQYLETQSINGLKNLKTLGLSSNPWSCDCRLRDFCQLLTTGSRSQLYSVPQICVGPARLSERRWEEVRPGEFACEPTVLLPVKSIQEEMNGNVSLACLASGDPEPEVWWQLNGGPVNGTKRSPDEVGPPGGLVTYSTSLETKKRLIQRWSNLTIYNASDIDAGEYTCHARNTAGTAQGTVAVSIPRVFSAPTLSQADNWLLWMSLAGGGAAALCLSASAVLLAACVCGSARRRSRRAKVKLQASASFGDQEKKLLDLSVTTTATTTSHQHSQSQNQMAMCAAPIQADMNHCQPEYELELEPRSMMQEHMCGQASASVTVERLRLQAEPHPSPQQHQPQQQSHPVLCPVAVAAAAAAGATRSFSPALPANIFISVSLASASQPEHPSPQQQLAQMPLQSVSQQQQQHHHQQQHPQLQQLQGPVGPASTLTGSIRHPNEALALASSRALESAYEAPAGTHERCYPDLLDIGLSSFATLPRRNLGGGRRELGSPYDNMGPRVTATGSSTFSLVEAPESLADLAPPPSQPPSTGNLATAAPLIQPPPEFVSL